MLVVIVLGQPLGHGGQPGQQFRRGDLNRGLLGGRPELEFFDDKFRPFAGRLGQRAKGREVVFGGLNQTHGTSLGLELQVVLLQPADLDFGVALAAALQFLLSILAVLFPDGIVGTLCSVTI